MLTLLHRMSFRHADTQSPEERIIPVAAIEFNTTSVAVPSRSDREELALITAEVFDELFRSFFSRNDKVQFSFVELKQYTMLTSRLFKFDFRLYFNHPYEIPSNEQIQVLALLAMTPGQATYENYVQQLQRMESQVFSTVSSVSWIGNEKSLQDTIKDERSTSLPSTNTGNDVLMIAASVTAAAAVSLLLVWAYLSCRSRTHSSAVTALSKGEEKSNHPDDHDASSVYTGTQNSEYRTSLFSDDGIEKGFLTRTLDSEHHVQDSELASVSLADHIEKLQWGNKSENTNHESRTLHTEWSEEIISTVSACNIETSSEAERARNMPNDGIDTRNLNVAEARKSFLTTPVFQQCFSASNFSFMPSQSLPPRKVSAAAKIPRSYSTSSFAPKKSFQPEWMTVKLRSINDPIDDGKPEWTKVKLKSVTAEHAATLTKPPEPKSFVGLSLQRQPTATVPAPTAPLQGAEPSLHSSPASHETVALEASTSTKASSTDPLALEATLNKKGKLSLNNETKFAVSVASSSTQADNKLLEQGGNVAALTELASTLSRNPTDANQIEDKEHTDATLQAASNATETFVDMLAADVKRTETDVLGDNQVIPPATAPRSTWFPKNFLAAKTIPSAPKLPTKVETSPAEVNAEDYTDINVAGALNVNDEFENNSFSQFSSHENDPEFFPVSPVMKTTLSTASSPVSAVDLNVQETVSISATDSEPFPKQQVPAITPVTILPQISPTSKAADSKKPAIPDWMLKFRQMGLENSCED
jgi:hypothetical protein